jgi:hypothetical protein
MFGPFTVVHTPCFINVTLMAGALARFSMVLNGHDYEIGSRHRGRRWDGIEGSVEVCSWRISE